MKLSSGYKFLIAAICTCLVCSTDNSITKGSGTQTTNGIYISSCQRVVSGYGFIIDSYDTCKITKSNLKIKLEIVSSNYQSYDSKGFSGIFHIDSTGSFFSDTLPSGIYNILAFDSIRMAALFINAIPVFDSIRDFSQQSLLSAWGRIEGIVHDTTELPEAYIGVYLTGIHFFAICDSLGRFILNNIPTGNYTLKADYFTRTRNSGFTRIKGFLSHSASDTMITFTDSISLSLTPDSLVKTVELNL